MSITIRTRNDFQTSDRKLEMGINLIKFFWNRIFKNAIKSRKSIFQNQNRLIITL